MFNIEESQGAIRKSPLQRELLTLRTEAETAERQRVARHAQEQVDRLFRESDDLAKAHRFQDALAKLAEAEALARILDPATQRGIVERKNRIRGSEKELIEARDRGQRIEQALAEGGRLLDDGRDTDAVVRFDEVLALEPRNLHAQQGKAEAQERILATTTRQAREKAFEEGKSLFGAGQYEDAIRRLTDAAADPASFAARELLQQAEKRLEEMRKQKELQRKIDALLAEGERLLLGRDYPNAWVNFESVLKLDAGNVRAKEKLALAQDRALDIAFRAIFPAKSPDLFFFAPNALDVHAEGPTLHVDGVATDDRGVARIEFRLGGRVVAQQDIPPRLESAESDRSFRFARELPLEPGPNELTITVTDTMGAPTSRTFRVTRRLQLWEKPVFIPSALATALGLVGLGFAVQHVRRQRAVRRRFNPYIAGAPVLDDGMFFGRQKLMNRILNVLHHNSLMITGERRIGKTTFLYHLKRALEADQGTEYRFFPVFTDLQGVPEQAFFHAVMADVADGLGLPEATRSSLRLRPGQAAYDGRDFSHDLQRIVEDLKTQTDKRVKLVLLIDEVDVLNGYSERINQRLRSIFMKTFSEHLVAIMSGVGIKRIWKSEGSPWYNFFDEIELKAFTREEAEALIREPVSGFFRYEPEAVEAVLEASRMKPYVIQKFCIHAVNWMLEAGRTTITVDDVEAVREAVLLDGMEEEGGGPAEARDLAEARTVAD